MSNVRAEVRIKPSRRGVLEYSETQITVGSKTYTFDRIHSRSSQKKLFSDSVVPLLEHFIAGYDCAVLAYGQTGSGKTYTMGISSTSEGAIVQNALEYLFKQGVPVACSFMEIYNEDIVDLLGESRVPLSIRQAGDSVSIVGLREHPLSSCSTALALLKRGCAGRSTTCTKMNSASSRSHAIFTLILRQSRGAGSIAESRLSFVDLAGSERLKRSQCEGVAARESICINGGLLALGNVINALYLRKSHVPFRDSKLTRIMQRCLSSHLLLIACVSPDQIDSYETMSTLKYASRAALISTEEKIHVEDDKDKAAIARLKMEISRLKDENMRLRGMVNRRFVEGSDGVRNHPAVLEIHRYYREIIEEYEKKLNDDKHKIDHKNATEKRRASASTPCDGKINGFADDDASSSRPAHGNENATNYDNEKVNGIAANNIMAACDTNCNTAAPVHNPKACSARVPTAPRPGRMCARRSSDTEDIKALNTLHNKHAIAAEAAGGPADKHRRVVSFSTEERPKRSLFTPKKEYAWLAPRLEASLEHPATAMLVRSGRLVFSSNDGKVREHGAEEAVLFSDDSIRCLAAGVAGSPLYYSTRALLKAFDDREKPMPVYAFRNEISALRVFENYALSGHEDGSLNLLDLRNNKILLSESAHASAVFGIEAAGDFVYTCSRDHSIRFMRCSNGDLAQLGGGSAKDCALSPPHYDVVSCLLSYKDTLVSLSRDCSMKTWRGSLPFKTVPYAHDAWIRAGAVLDGCWMTGCKGGQLRCWDLCEESVRCIGRADTGSPVVCMAGAGDRVWVGCQRGIQLYRVSSGK